MTLEMVDLRVAYLAGIIDADGSIPNCAVHPGEFSKQIAVTVANNSLALMEWLVGNFGGSYYVPQEAGSSMESPQSGKKYTRRADTYLWHCSASHAVIVMKIILPHLIIKKDRAETMIAQFYEDMVRFKKVRTQRMHGLTKAVRFFQERGYVWEDNREGGIEEWK